MSDLVHDISHVPEALARLLEQYQGLPDPEAIITILATEIQKAEDALWGIATLRNINTATANQLDQLGTIVGFPRNTTDDDIYRLEIRAKIVKNVSQGQADRLISVYLFMTEATVVDYSDAWPMSVFMMSDGMIPASLTDANLIYSLVKGAAAGGVKIGALGLFDGSGPFGFAGPMNIAKGFASVANPTDGGKFGHLLRERHPFGFGVQNAEIRGFGTISLNEPNIGGNFVGV